MKTTDTEVCIECGTPNVYRAAWVGVNDGDVIDLILKHSADGADGYCGDCFMEVFIVTEAEFKERQKDL